MSKIPQKWIDDINKGTMNRPNVYEKKVCEFIKHHILKKHEVKTFVDGGASFGYYTRFMAENMEPGSCIWAIEADHARYDILKMNAIQWDIPNNVSIMARNFALGDRNDKIKFYTNHTGYSGSIKRNGNPWLTYNENDYHDVQMTTLDNLFELISIDLIKLDIEGAEDEAILGARELIKRCRPMFIIEAHKCTPPQTYNDILVGEFGYKVKLISGGHRFYA